MTSGCGGRTGLALFPIPGALDRPPVRVLLESFDDHAITYFMRVWTRRAANISRFKDGVNSRIWYQLKRHGIDIPFPIRTIHMHEAPDMEQHRQGKALSKASELFSGLDIFQELDAEIVRQLAASSQRRLFDAGEVLVSEGDEGDSLFVVEKGAVRVTKSDPGIYFVAVEFQRFEAEIQQRRRFQKRQCV